jgi:thymidylate synthase
MTSNETYTFKTIYHKLQNFGKIVCPRGQKVLEIEDFSYLLPPYMRFQNFPERKLNLQYIKDEFMWYLRGDAHDTSIVQKAGIWKNYVKDDGTINSNYGQYVFGDQNQFDRVIKALIDDKDSRRASIAILGSQHILSDDADLPCTCSLNFRIRDNKLNMSVHMRSQDAVFGFTNDAPAFSFIHEMVFNALLLKYPDLQCGRYHHSVDSFHVYERHFEMFEKLCSLESEIEHIECPKMNGPKEVELLRSLHLIEIDSEQFKKNIIENDFRFIDWLTTKVVK